MHGNAISYTNTFRRLSDALTVAVEPILYREDKLTKYLSSKTKEILFTFKKLRLDS